MKAIILAGGFGKRLKPLTDYLPKPLIPVLHRPIIEWQIQYLKKFGIRDILICAGYKSEQLVTYLREKRLGVKLEYSVEKTPIGTAGAIKNAYKYIDLENFFVLNGDVITNMNLNKLMIHQNSIAVIPLRTTYGIVHIESSKVKHFEEKPELSSHWMNAGLYYLAKNIMKDLPKNGNLENTLFPCLAKKGQLNAVKYNNVFWKSIDSYKDIEECEQMMQKYQYEKFILKK